MQKDRPAHVRPFCSRSSPALCLMPLPAAASFFCFSYINRSWRELHTLCRDHELCYNQQQYLDRKQLDHPAAPPTSGAPAPCRYLLPEVASTDASDLSSKLDLIKIVCMLLPGQICQTNYTIALKRPDVAEKSICTRLLCLTFAAARNGTRCVAYRPRIYPSYTINCLHDGVGCNCNKRRSAWTSLYSKQGILRVLY